MDAKPNYTNPDIDPATLDPSQRMLREYGITEYVPDEATLTYTRHGIVIDVFGRGADGDLLFHQDGEGRNVDIVTVRRFYPHPKSTA